MELDPKISIGNLITSISVIVSIIGLCIAWIKDRRLKIKTNANLIRNSAAKTLRGIERWKEITLSISYKCDSDFVETSELLSEKEVIEQSEIEKARDFLWKKLMSIIADNRNQILKEDLKNAYFEMFQYSPDIRLLYESTILKLEKAEDEMIDDFIATNSQKAILNINEHIQGKYYSAILGNQLRYIRNNCMDRYSKALEYSIKEIREILTEIIRETDKKLTRYSNVYTK